MRRILIFVIGIPVLYVSLMFGASEFGGEVATLLRPKQDGGVKNVRVWIVNAGDDSLIEHGDSSSFWIKQLNSQPEISLIRDGEEKKYFAEPDANAHDLYHRLRREKYGIADRIVEIGSFGSQALDTCIYAPVRLRKE